MTKSEAIKQLELGKKLTHRFFDNHEFIQKAKDGSGMIEFEDGNLLSPFIFWADRPSDAWDKDWEFFTSSETEKS